MTRNNALRGLACLIVLLAAIPLGPLFNATATGLLVGIRAPEIVGGGPLGDWATIGSGSARTVMTSVVRFIKEAELGSVFDDQATKAMGEAFDAACKVLDEAGQSSVVYEAVAKCIIEVAKSGERDPNRLRDRALATLRS